MTLHVPRLPFSLDPLIAEAKRRARQRRVLLVLLVIGAAAATVGIAVTRPWSGGTTQAGPMRRYMFSVEAVNPSRVVNDVSYVSLSSPVVLPRRKLTRTMLFDITGGFYLTKASPRGSILCSFAKRITDSTVFPAANGKTVTVKVYGKRASPGLNAQICKAFESFSLTWPRPQHH